MQCKSGGNMDDVVTENVCTPPSIVPETQETPDVKTTESAENFQKFMYELFEKNGVINDLRAYLRGHIIGILHTVRTGDPPPCQKHFTQRLEFPYQALNMLIAEYLLRLEFSYTVSVFISEIPLANMVLDFARSLMQSTEANPALRFKDEDVWSILNYLGVKCDSEHATSIVEMYKEETQSPLLLCMLKCMTLSSPLGIKKGSSLESLSSSIKSSDTAESHPPPSSSHCKHLVSCKTCHGMILRIKEKYRRKRRSLAQSMTESSVKPQNVDSLMKNIDLIERGLIDEMFQQLKSVYEAEIQMAKTEEEVRVKRTLATHAVQLKNKRIEMEEDFKARELELSRCVQHKKRFLWGLARLLRDQHQQMACAMRDVQAETSRLAAKEDNLKSQMAEAEAVLRSRGEEMRQQISAELTVLEGHLDSMKQERDTINKERSELEIIKHVCESNSAIQAEASKEHLCTHYDLLKNEFNTLKKYLEAAKLEPKCLVERSTITDGSTRTDAVLNNGQDLDRSKSEDRLKTKVVNDLKKMKNVNFSQSNLAELYRERSRSSASHSTVSSEGDTRDEARDARDGRDPRHARRRGVRDAMRRLLEENERLRTFARQQREHIDELSSHQARLQAELTAATAPVAAAPPPVRPRTAPPNMPNQGALQRMSANSVQPAGHGWRKGAGEEMSFLLSAQPRIVVPGDTVPFIGVVRDRHNDNRRYHPGGFTPHTRYLINQWRSLRRRASPASGAGRRAAASSRARDLAAYNGAGPSVRLHSEEELNSESNPGGTMEHACELSRVQYEQKPKISENSVKIYDKSPACTLRDPKERSKSKEYRCEREPSPESVIRDAKLRLRKLEIEAEAVEASYRDFRRKQDALRPRDIDLKLARPFGSEQSELESTSRYIPRDPREQIMEDIAEYRAKYDLGATRFNNKNATPVRVRPIPAAAAFDPPKTQNYLETSLTEFRKYYYSEKRALEDFEQPRTSQATRFENQSPKTPFISPRLTEDRVPILSPTNRRINHESTPNTSHNEDSMDRIGPNSTINRDIPTSPGSTEMNRTRSPKLKPTKGFRTEVFRQTTHKAKELEILKQNISKIYNLPEKTSAEHKSYNKTVENAKWEMENERKNIIEDTITEVSRDSDSEHSKVDDKNLLRIEVQSVSKVDDVKVTESQTKELLLVVESSNVADHSDIDYQQDILPTQMTILVTPKLSDSEKSDQTGLKSVENSNAGEKCRQSGNDILNAIYQADANENKSSIQMQLDNSKDVLVPFLSDVEMNEEDGDDFSAEMENLNSLRYDSYQEHSPISMPKTSEDDNFWDS